ncbi:hypothetical protein OG401_01130 [Kitasatospora purpeofusca]|uniref:hypothetical protein n=1 Tax=Kitasatospora purpeofusca TaxID=67352 RepID=UPI002252E8E0|nr:hypothetical protein [Kitasatospora purpeofusca]MCX4682922.1 hypothetical protein [Kitasatospora purpeofusca]
MVSDRTASDLPPHRPTGPRTAFPGLRLVTTDAPGADRDRGLQLRLGPDGRCVLGFSAPGVTDRSALGADVRTRLPLDQHRALEQVFAAARCHDFALAVRRADGLLTTLASSFGPHHRFTLSAAEVRADLAWLSGEAWCAAEFWMLIAEGWARLEGPAGPLARFGARQAAASWWEVPDAEAAIGGTALLAVLLLVTPGPDSDPVVRAVRRRMNRIALSAPGRRRRTGA